MKVKQSKACLKCGETKLLEKFHHNSSQKDGHSNWCKICFRAYRKARNRADSSIVMESLVTQVKDLRGDSRQVPSPVRKPDSIPEKLLRKTDGTGMKTTKYLKNCFLEGYKNLRALGLSQIAVQKIFGSSRGGLDNNTIYDKEGEEAYQLAMAELQSKLSHHMIIKGIGYDYKEEKITYLCNKETKKWEKSKKEVCTRHYPGSIEALLAFLYNKFPDQWKNSREIVSKKQPYDNDPRQRDRKKIEALARDVLEAGPSPAATECVVQGGPTRLSGECEQAVAQ